MGWLIHIFQVTFSFWTLSIMSDFLTWSTLSCFTQALMIYWLSVPPNASRGLFHLLNPSLYIPALKEEIQFYLTAFSGITKICTQTCSGYSGNTPPRFQRWAGRAATKGCGVPSSVSLKENLSIMCSYWYKMPQEYRECKSVFYVGS